MSPSYPHTPLTRDEALLILNDHVGNKVWLRIDSPVGTIVRVNKRQLAHQPLAVGPTAQLVHHALDCDPHDHLGCFKVGAAEIDLTSLSAAHTYMAESDYDDSRAPVVVFELADGVTLTLILGDETEAAA